MEGESYKKGQKCSSHVSQKYVICINKIKTSWHYQLSTFLFVIIVKKKKKKKKKKNVLYYFCV